MFTVELFVNISTTFGKNLLYAYSAVVYSIIETAKENGLMPFEYLEFLFETLPNTTTGRIDSLLPWGEAVPERCRMPVKREDDQDGQAASD